MSDVLVPLFLFAFLAVWIGALMTLLTDQTLDGELRDRWILPLVFLPPLTSIAFLVWRHRRRHSVADSHRVSREEARGMKLDLRHERQVARLAVAWLCVLVFFNLLGVLGRADAGFAAQLERYAVPLVIVVPFAGVAIVALWGIALRTLASDRNLPSHVRGNWILPLVFLGPITAPIFVIWRWRRYLRGLSE